MANRTDTTIHDYLDDAGLDFEEVDEGHIFERVVWSRERPMVVEANKLADLDMPPSNEGIYGVHASGDPVYWVWRLERDYMNDPNEAWLISIDGGAGEAWVYDPQQQQGPAGGEGYSGFDEDDDDEDLEVDEWENLYPEDAFDDSSVVLITRRRYLVEGRDFTVVGRFNPETMSFEGIG